MNGQRHVHLTARRLRLVRLQTPRPSHVFLDFTYNHMQATPTRSQNVAEFIKGLSTYTIVLFFEQRNISISVTNLNESCIDNYIRTINKPFQLNYTDPVR